VASAANWTGLPPLLALLVVQQALRCRLVSRLHG
jgi:hypothetical protein